MKLVGQSVRRSGFLLGGRTTPRSPCRVVGFIPFVLADQRTERVSICRQSVEEKRLDKFEPRRRLTALLGCWLLHSYLVLGLVHYINMSCLSLNIKRTEIGELRFATNLCGLSGYMYLFLLILWTGILRFLQLAYIFQRGQVVHKTNVTDELMLVFVKDVC